MPPLHVQNINLDLIRPLLYWKCTSDERVIEQACNLTIASSKKRLQHNNRGIIQREKIKEANELSKSLQFVT